MQGFFFDIMAKELPYFKFEPAEWQNGDIQMCDFETQIKFLDICCSYWSRIGELPYAYAMQKICGGNANALKTLEKYQIIKVEGELIRISFLDKQLDELQSKSEKARESAEKRWKATKTDANALETQSERNAKRKEENRKEKKKEDNKETALVFLSFRDELFNRWINYRKEIKKPLKETSVEALKNTWQSKSDIELEAIINQSIANGWQGLFELKQGNNQQQQYQQDKPIDTSRPMKAYEAEKLLFSGKLNT